MPDFKKRAANTPRLVNRGPAGLLTKVSGKGKPAQQNGEGDGANTLNEDVIARVAAIPSESINRIASALEPLIVPIDSLIPDPLNARQHPERNQQAIKESLIAYGQVKPIIVSKETRHIIAGNGTWQAAKSMGWTSIAAVLVEMSQAEAVGYGLADNRTAELARWDFAMVAKLDAILQEQGLGMIGWSKDELEVLRIADFSPPVIDDSGYNEGDENKEEQVRFSEEQRGTIDVAVAEMRLLKENPSLTIPQALVLICQAWVAARGTDTESS